MGEGRSLREEGPYGGLPPLQEARGAYGNAYKGLLRGGALFERKVLKARVACIHSQGLGSYSSIISGTRRAVRQHQWKVLGLLARLSLALEPATLSAATLAAGKCGARGSLSLGFRV